eukprot:scaffold87297_cov37-Prasinocladus_malaysianus.AAC.1
MDGQMDRQMDRETGRNGQSHWVASASKDSTMRIWDASNGECVGCEAYPGGQCSALQALQVLDHGGSAEATLWRIPGHKAAYQSLICGASLNGAISVWGLKSQRWKTGEEKPRLKPVAFSS